MNPAARQKLVELVARFGRDICDDPQRCEALLRDVYGDQHQREVFVLVAAVKNRAASELAADASGVPKEVLLARLSHRLHCNFGFTEDLALWCVETWALALGAPTHAHDKPASAQKPVSPPKKQKAATSALKARGVSRKGTGTSGGTSPMSVLLARGAAKLRNDRELKDIRQRLEKANRALTQYGLTIKKDEVLKVVSMEEETALKLGAKVKKSYFSSSHKRLKNLVLRAELSWEDAVVLLLASPDDFIMCSEKASNILTNFNREADNTTSQWELARLTREAQKNLANAYRDGDVPAKYIEQLSCASDRVTTTNAQNIVSEDIKCRCSHCGQKLAFAPAMLNTTVECPTCKKGTILKHAL